MRNEILATLVTMLIAIMALVPFASDDSSAENFISCNGVDIKCFDDSKDLQAGGSVDFILHFNNNNPSNVSVRISVTDDGSDLIDHVGDTIFSIDGGMLESKTIHFSADKLSRHGLYQRAVDVTVLNYGTSTQETETMTLTLNVVSSYSSENNFNKVLGIFPLPEPFGEPIHSALLTEVLWFLFALFLYVALHLTINTLFNNDKNKSRRISRKAGAFFVLSILLIGTSNALMVYGAEEAVVAFSQDITKILYIPIVAYVSWVVYSNLIFSVFHRMEKQDKIVLPDTSLIPLFNLIGKIAIAMIAISAFLGVIGFDLVAIITGAGIAGMAITLGAQNTLTELFSGINLLTTRPFRKGDMVMIGSKDIYEVEKVGLMNSRFKNWINLEHIVMPNSLVSSSTIINVTGKTMAYRLFLFFTVAYESDLEKTKSVILETAGNHPQVITDGSYSPPDVRLNAFYDSSIEFRLAAYINDFRDSITVTDELNEDVYRNLCKANIEIPYDKLDVYIREDNDITQ